MTITTPTTTGTTQSISVGIRAAGDQQVTVDTHGCRGDRSGYISVTADGVVVYAYDPRAAATYAAAFIDLTGSPLLHQLPERIDEVTVPERHCADDSPAIVIRAHGHDQTRHFAVPGRDDARGAVGIRIGQVTWLIQDRAAYRAYTAAYRAYTAAWRQVHNLTPIVLGGVAGLRTLG